jgi:hypothetical protein
MGRRITAVYMDPSLTYCDLSLLIFQFIRFLYCHIFLIFILMFDHKSVVYNLEHVEPSKGLE